ncbi:hypothetical protein GCM10023216_10310 [Isoptericola chiayiensis]|uniref:Alpha/beta hydrolase fold-5 domain-containing protein n=1 Tax=Isoptericola chiayiensis TaxID=579446 RepID=A0ABP8YBB7_9MICO|nr:alpha/beta hydrolase [Isoptericola chiayiensis]
MSAQDDRADEHDRPDTGGRHGTRWAWTTRALAAAALAVVAWACLTASGAIVHGHPAYGVLLAVTTFAAVALLWRSTLPRGAVSGWHLARRVVGLVGAVAWIAAIAWLRPFDAVEPAPSALEPDDAVAVTESATTIELAPTGEPSGTALLYQPGAKVEARAYAAVLRPLAEAGHTVVVVQQPLGIGFLATGAFDDARDARPEVDRWVLGGHSLGGVVAATQADDDASDEGTSGDEDAVAPVAGLLLHASYPAGDVSDTLTAAVASVSGSEDGLTTPAAIEDSRADLPAGTTFTVVEGAVHAFFGDYGPQPGDGTPTIDHDDARQQISAASLRFMDAVTPG